MKLTKVQNMILGVMIGDSYGSAYEFRFKDRRQLKEELDFTKYNANPREDFNDTPGMYTDDTQMTLGVIDALIDEKKFSKTNLAEHFIQAYRRDPINGYARGFQAFIEQVQTGEEFIQTIKPHSERNGAAMRSIPIGILPEENKVIEYAKINASITHNTPKGHASSVAVALLAHYFLYDKDKETDMFTYINTPIQAIDKESANHFLAVKNMNEFNSVLMFREKNKDKGIPCDGMRTVGGVLHVLKNYEQPSDVLREAVLLGGDTDSTASIALGLNMIKHTKEELPPFLFKDLTNHLYGRDYIISLGEKLNNKFNI